MKITGPIVKDGLARAMVWFEKSRYQVQDSLEAGSICDAFEHSARRVPRNICADPAVEAKRVVSKSFKIGLVAFSRSLVNCLNEADEDYIREFADALKLFASEYLGLQLSFIVLNEEQTMRFEFLMTGRVELPSVRVRAVRNLNDKNSARVNMIIVPEAPMIIRQATDEDFFKMIFTED